MKIKRLLLRHFNLAVLLLFIIVAAVAAESFFSVRNLMNIVRQMSVLGLLALGMSFVVLSGHMDLSVGAVMTFSGLIVISFQEYMPAAYAIIFALLTGLVIGLLNGILVCVFKANSGESLMITFGTQLVLTGVSLIYTKGYQLGGSDSAFFNAIGSGYLGAIPIPVMILGLFAAILGIVESKTVFGRELHMSGYNAEASRLAGIGTNRIKMLSYGVSGLLAASAAIVLSSRTLGATPTAGQGYELDAIVALVLGGMSLNGGYGSIWGTLIGILTFGVIGNTMNLLGFAIHDQMIVKGVILILAILMDVWNQKQLRKG